MLQNSKGSIFLKHLLGGDMTGAELDDALNNDDNQAAFRIALANDGDSSNGRSFLVDNAHALLALSESSRASALFGAQEEVQHYYTLGFYTAESQLEAKALYLDPSPKSQQLFRVLELASPHGMAGQALVFCGLTWGSSSETVAKTSEQYLFAFPGFRGNSPASLDLGVYNPSMVGSKTKAWVLNSWYTTSVKYTTMVEYSFASPGTLGASPGTAAHGGWGAYSGCNSTLIFSIGGATTATSGVLFEAGVTYLWASPGSLGTEPAALTTARESGSATANQTQMFVFGGYTTTTTGTCEQYLFATPGSKGSAPAALSLANYASSAASNSSRALVFHGYNSGYRTSIDVYSFASPGTREASPISASASGNYSAAAASTTNIFKFGSKQGTQPNVVVENFRIDPLTKEAMPVRLDSGRRQAGAASNVHGGL